MRQASRLVIHGGTPAVTEPVAKFNTIGQEEADAAHGAVLGGPLSGYLGGERRGGYHVERLEAEWEDMFHVRHAIACNSATSGILIACMAAEVEGKTVRTTPYTMSGTIAPAKLLGANIIFGDIDPDSFCLKPAEEGQPKYITITTNLFGHPSEQHMGRFVIEDAAQSILSTKRKKYVDYADITVFSGNVHKAVQCGEGGMCVTNNPELADKIRYARNHGELAGSPFPGLNLRLTEVQAAIWYVQLKKSKKIIEQRREIAAHLSEAAEKTQIGDYPTAKTSCVHSYYVWALKVSAQQWMGKALQAEGVPISIGYGKPLYKLPAFQQPIHRKVVESTEKKILIYENCSYTPTTEQLKQFKKAFQKVADRAHRD